MKQSELDRAVATVTGESRRTIAHYGFQLEETPITNSDALEIGLDCPGCGHLVLVATDQPSFTKHEAECVTCDAFYPFDLDELLVIESQELSLQSA